MNFLGNNPIVTWFVDILGSLSNFDYGSVGLLFSTDQDVDSSIS